MNIKKINGSYRFKDYPDFRPNLSPRDIFKMGSFGGTYWRPIYSSIIKKKLKNQHLKYPMKWWKDIPEEYMINGWDDYDKNINKYNVRVGTTLEFWENKNWITKYHPYGWIEWYCDFFQGNRCPDDERQINRWNKIAGPKGRFRKWLITLIINRDGKYNDNKISPSIRQTLQHWGYKLNKKDFDRELKYRSNN